MAYAVGSRPMGHIRSVAKMDCLMHFIRHSGCDCVCSVCVKQTQTKETYAMSLKQTLLNRSSVYLHYLGYKTIYLSNVTVQPIKLTNCV